VNAPSTPLFGPRREDGVTRFRLFAPSSTAVALEVEGCAPIALLRTEDGFWDGVAAAPPGTRYRFRVGGLAVPDPASRRQSGGVHAWSVVTDPQSYNWTYESWSGKPWETSVIY